MTTWGAAQCDSTNCFRIGYDVSYSPSSVGTGTSYVDVSVTLRLQTKYYANDSGVNWSINGGFAPSSGTKAFDHNSGTAWSSSNITVLGTVTRRINTSYTAAQSGSFTASVNGLVAIAGTASVSGSWSVAKRPISAPATPGTTTISRSSDSRINVSWPLTNPDNAAAPVQNVEVYRSMNGGTYYRVATVGKVTSYTDTTTVANARYQYKVRTKNTAGYSGFGGASNVIDTTAAAPSNVVATKSGNDIVVTWQDNSAYNDTYEVWHAADGVWDATPIASPGDVPGNETWTHTAPNASVTHTYKVRAHTANPSLLSAFSPDSNVVQLLTSPNAPTQLSPSSTARDGSGDIALSWKHNPVDTTAQTAFEVQHRVAGGAWASTGKIASGASSWTLPADTYANGQVLEWQVRTWGDYVNPSPWSATASLPLSSAPTVTIDSPDGASAVNVSTLTASWTYYDAEGDAQASWKAILRSATGTALETRTGAGAASSVAFSRRLEDGKSYEVAVSVQDATGLWSSEATASFTVAFAVPAQPAATLTWLPDDGAVAVTVDNPPPVASRTNLLANASFEENTGEGATGWAGARGTLTAVESDEARFGSNVCEYRSTDASSNGGNYMYSLAYTPVDADVAHTWSVYLKPDAPATAAADGGLYAKVWVQWYNGATFVSTEVGALVPVTDGEWVRLSFTATVPSAGVTAGRCFLVVDGNAGVTGLQVGDGYYVDAGLFEASDTLNRFIEGTVTETDTDHNEVWRSLDGGDTWALVADQVPVGSTVTDHIPALEATNTYKVVAVTTLPSTTESELSEVVTTGAGRVFVNAGPGFSKVAKFRHGVLVDDSASRAKVLNQFAGREDPVEFAGEQRVRTIGLRAALFKPGSTHRTAESSTWEDVLEVADEAAPACFRDLEGRRLFVSTGQPALTGAGTGISRGVAWTFTKDGYTEPTEV